MEYENPINIRCIFCKHELQTDKKFAKENGRVFCPHCCKSFEYTETESQFPDWLKTYIKDDEE